MPTRSVTPWQLQHSPADGLKAVQNDAAPNDATEEEKFKYYGRLGGSDGKIVYAFAQTFGQFAQTFAGMTVHMPVAQGVVSRFRRGELCK